MIYRFAAAFLAALNIWAAFFIGEFWPIGPVNLLVAAIMVSACVRGL